MSAHLLLVDDDGDIRRLLEARLKQKGYEVTCGACIDDLWESLQSGEFQAVLLDYQLPDGDGISAIPDVHAMEPALPVIIITALGSIETAVEAMKNGAFNFCPKPIDFDRLETCVQNAVEQYHLKHRLTQLERSRRRTFQGMVGGSAEMQVIYNTIETVAPSKAPVLITGESGTGKELVASAIHKLSPRKSKQLVDVNCAAIPKDLLESELFGHEKSAFTGATDRNIGRCEQAHESTLFLDEIGEMDLGLQAKMLRFLQEKCLYRVGGKQKIEVDARIISATNREPEDAIEEGILREDLYYRLNVVNIHLPPLRERTEDILPLANYFLRKYAKENERDFDDIRSDTIEMLCAYQWKGNVRELENVIQQCAVMHNGKELTPEMLPANFRKTLEKTNDQAEATTEGRELFADEIVPLDELERNAIDHALTLTKGNVTKTSAALNISQATLYRKIRDYDFQLKKYK